MLKMLSSSHKLLTIILLGVVAVDCHFKAIKYSSLYSVYAETIRILVDQIFTVTKMKILLIFPSLAELDFDLYIIKNIIYYMKLFFIEYNEVMRSTFSSIICLIQVLEVRWNTKHTLFCLVSNLLWCAFMLTSTLRDCVDVDPLFMSLIRTSIIIKKLFIITSIYYGNISRKLYNFHYDTRLWVPVFLSGLFVLITPKQRIKLLPLDTTTTNDDVSQNSGVHSSNSSNESTIMVNNNNNTTGYDLVRAKPKYNSKNAIMSNRSSSIHQNMEDTDSKGSRSLIAQTTITARINYTVLRSCTTLSNVAYSAPLNYSLSISKVCYIHSWLAACQPWQRMGGWEGDSSVSSLEESGSDYTRYSTDTEIPESASCWNLPRF